MKKMTSIWIASALMLSVEGVAAAGYYKVEKVLANNGKMLNKTTIASSAKAPLGLSRPKFNVSLSTQSSSDGELTKNKQSAISNILSGMAVSTWSFGCTPTSGAMIAGYYDRHGFDDIYTGPANGGVMPANNEDFWPDDLGDADGLHQNPLSASRQDVDGHSGYGHVDDYWVEYNDNGTDPYDSAGRTEHSADSIADFMKTNIHAIYENMDGATTIYSYEDETPLTAIDMEEGGVSDKDGAYGLKSFMESRGYTVDTLYTQQIDARVSSGGFTFNDYKVEIDAGHPVMIHLAGHTVVGVGYDTSGSDDIVILYDTWDFDQHTMVWGEQYGEGSEAMDHESVSVIHISHDSPSYAPVANAGADQVVFEDDSVTLSASGSRDSDGSIVSYSWKEGSVILSTLKTFTRLNFSEGYHTITLTVTDDDGLSASDTVKITVRKIASSTGGGCTYNSNSTGFDLMVLLMLLASISYPLRRKLFR